MPEMDTTSTLRNSAESSAAETTTDTSSSPGVQAGSGWGAILSDTAEHDTQQEGAEVANGAVTEEEPTGADATAEAGKPEPWHKDPRWQAFQEEKALLDQIKPLIEPLLSEYGGVEGIQAQIAERKREEDAAQQAAVLQRDQATIEKRLQDEIETGKLDPDAYQQALQYEVANARLYRIEMGNAVQSAQTQYPDADFELVQALGHDPQSVAILAKHTHGKVAALKAQHATALKTAGERAVAEYVASQAAAKGSPAPEGGGGSGSGAPRSDHKNLGSWGSILGGRGRRV